MPDPDIESILLRYRPAGPDATLRQKILTPAPIRIRRWPIYAFRSAIAASLLVSFLLLHAAKNLDRSAAQALGPAPTLWTPEAKQMADLLGPQGKTYIALCLRTDAQTSKYPPEQMSHIP